MKQHATRRPRATPDSIGICVGTQLALFGAMWPFNAKRPDIDHRALVAQGALLLDVRNPDEFAERHLPGALNIPVDQLEARIALIGPKDRAVVVHCRSGARSARATAILRAAGYTAHDIGAMSNW